MFKERFTRLCNERGESPSAVCVKVGLSNSTYSMWDENSMPRKATLLRMSDYFGVSVEYLKCETDEREPTSENHPTHNTAQKILELMGKNDMDNQALAEQLGLNRQVVTDWKAGRSKSYKKYLYQIAKVFNVSVEYLKGEEHEKAPTKVEANAIFLEDKKMYMIPLFESVSAGFGVCAVNEIIGYEPCYINNPAEAAESLCIKVQGDSMYPKIEDGDIIQVHKQTSVDSGSVAVVLLDGEEGLVKKVVYGDDWIELHSFNPIYPTMRFEGPDVLRIRVVGLVKAIIKRL